MARISEQAKQNRLERVWLLVQRHPNGITEAEAAERLGMDRRTVNNYLNELGDEGKIQREQTMWYPSPYVETRLRSLELSPEEAYTLYLGSRLLVKQHDKRNEPAETAMHKLAHVLTEDAGVGREIAQAAAELAQRPRRPGYEDIFRTLVRGYIYRKAVAISYRPLHSRPFQTTLHTYLMEPSAIGFATYAIGYSSLPAALRAYKVERIESAALTRENYSVPADFPGLEILRHAWSIFFGEATVTVTLRFSPAVRARVLETQWHPSQRVSEDDERPGWLRWQADLADITDVLPWVRGWGADVQAVAPDDLRAKLAAEAQALARLYGWQVGAPGNSTTVDDFFFGD